MDRRCPSEIRIEVCRKQEDKCREIPRRVRAQHRNGGVTYALTVVTGRRVLAVLPSWPYSRGWGYYPSGGLGLVLLILLLLFLMGRI